MKKSEIDGTGPPGTSGQQSSMYRALLSHAKYWLPLVSIAIGAVHQAAFWWPFHVDFLSYFGVQDLVRVSFMPLVAIALVFAALIALPAMLAERFFGTPMIPSRDHRLTSQLAGLKRDRLWVLPILVVVLGYQIIFYVWNWTHSDIVLFTGAITTVLVTALILRAFPVGEIQSTYLRYMLAFAIGSLIPMAVANGTLGAEEIKDGYGLLLSGTGGRKVAEIFGPNAPPKLWYLGHMGEYDFFYGTDKLTYVVRSEELPVFSVERIKHDEQIRFPFFHQHNSK